MTDLAVRVKVLDAWDEVTLTVPASTPVADVKRAALVAVHAGLAPTEYLVKFRGAEVRDESVSLSQHGIPSDGALIVLRRRRSPVA